MMKDMVSSNKLKHVEMIVKNVTQVENIFSSIFLIKSHWNKWKRKAKTKLVCETLFQSKKKD